MPARSGVVAVDQDAGLAIHQASDPGQFGTLSSPGEQLGAQVFLQLMQLAAEDGLGNRAGIGYGQEGAKAL